MPKEVKQTSPVSLAEPVAKKNLSKKAIAKQSNDRVDGLRHDMIKEGEHGDTEEEIDDL